MFHACMDGGNRCWPPATFCSPPAKPRHCRSPAGRIERSFWSTNRRCGCYASGPAPGPRGLWASGPLYTSALSRAGSPRDAPSRLQRHAIATQPRIAANAVVMVVVSTIASAGRRRWSSSAFCRWPTRIYIGFGSMAFRERDASLDVIRESPCKGRGARRARLRLGRARERQSARPSSSRSRTRHDRAVSAHGRDRPSWRGRYDGRGDKGRKALRRHSFHH